MSLAPPIESAFSKYDAPMRRLRISLAALCPLVCTPAFAHSFGVVYTLPIPFWLYAWGAGAALIVSFAATGFVATRAPASATTFAARAYVMPRALVGLLRGVGLAMLLLTLASGLYGTPNAYENFSMTAFWIVFLLGMAYVQALLGDLYRVMNPWRSLCDALQRVFPNFGAANARERLLPGYAVAIGLYLGLIWVELFGGVTPRGLALLLGAYSLLCIVGVAVFGREAWFDRAEMFSVLMGLLARCGPLRITVSAHDEVRVQPQRLGAGLATSAAPGGLLLFILLVLAATAFDGVHETEFWYRLYWVWLYPTLLADWLGSNPLLAYPKLREGYLWWQSVWMLLFPLLYLGALWLCVALMRRLLGYAGSAWQLACEFAYSLLPIALVYHAAHYYTLLWTQGVKILPLLSDPFGHGHDWFGSADWFARVNLPDVTQVWHVQVALIVIGHAASVVLAHQVALRVFGSRRRAILSQLPMLALMVAYTVAGLWILSQPFQGGR